MKRIDSINIDDETYKIESDVVSSNDASSADLNLGDENGEVVVQFEGGHIKTKNFDSRKSGIDASNDASSADLSLGDENGEVVVQFEGGHIKTKNFDSRNSGTGSVGGVPIENYFINLKGKTIYLYGDSISSTDYSHYKDELSKLTNATVINGGHSGWTTAALAASGPLEQAIAAKPDVIFILVGGNDVGTKGTVGTFGTYGGLLADETKVSIPNIQSAYAGTKWIEAVAYITQYLSYNIGGYRHNAYKAGKCTDVGNQLESENDLDNIIKPIVVLCSTLPQQRNNATNVWADPINSKRKADACREVAQLLHVPLLDFSVLAGFNLINEPYWTSPTDKIHNKGTYMMDGLHPNKFGYRRMARLAYDFIRPYFIQ